MNVESVPKLVQLCRDTLIGRPNIHPTLDWAAQHPFALASLVDDLDQAVNLFNQQGSGPSIPDYAHNALALRAEMPELVAPTMTEVVGWGVRYRHRSARFMRTINRMMRRGESTKEEPYLAFHTQSIDPEARAVGGMLHILSETMVAMGRIPDSRRGQIVDAIIETTSPYSRVMDAVASPDRLDWVRTGVSLDPGFKEQISQISFPPVPEHFPVEPYRQVGKEEIWSPTTLYQNIMGVIYMTGVANAGAEVREVAERLNAQISRNTRLWGGNARINRWLRRYAPEHPLLTEEHYTQHNS